MQEQGKKERVQKAEELDASIHEVEEEYSCLGGKLFMIPDKKKWIFTLCLVQIPTILHQILHLEWFSHQHYFGVIIVLFLAHFINLWTFFHLCLEDPGFIQRIKYGYEIHEDHKPIPKNESINSHIVISYVAVGKQQTQRLKLCSTCNIYRPGRTSHCSECGVCVERMDHHCPWVGTCIGKKNYKYFYVFLLSLFILIIVVMVMCIMIMVGQGRDFGQTLKKYPFSMVLVLLPCLEGLIFVGIMLGFHTYLLTIDQTTKEYLDEKWIASVGNPERKSSCLKSCMKIFFKTQPSNSKYRHQAFPYYSNQPQSSSNTNNRNSKNSDPSSSNKQRKQKEQSSLSEESFHSKNTHKQVGQNVVPVSIQSNDKIAEGKK